LGEPARRLLERLSWLGPEQIPESLLSFVVPGGNEAVVDQSVTLAELATYSLVARARDAATFNVHRLVQDVTRRSLMEEQRKTALRSAMAMIDIAFRGDYEDLRVRPMLEILAPHVRAVMHHSDAEEMFEGSPALPGRLADLLRDRVPLAEVEP